MTGKSNAALVDNDRVIARLERYVRPVRFHQWIRFQTYVSIFCGFHESHQRHQIVLPSMFLAEWFYDSETMAGNFE